MLAGAGLAIGAVLGAMFPATRAENELMGEASDSIKRRAKEAAEEQIGKGKQLAGRVWEDAKQEASRMGFSASGDAASAEPSQSAGENTDGRDQEDEFGEQSRPELDDTRPGVN